MPADFYRSPVPEQLWERIRNEFRLPSLEQVRERLSTVQEDPEPVIWQLFRVFIDEGTYCPGFQFRPGLTLEPVVVALFERAMQLGIPHNCGAVDDGPLPRAEGIPSGGPARQYRCLDTACGAGTSLH